MIRVRSVVIHFNNIISIERIFFWAGKNRNKTGMIPILRHCRIPRRRANHLLPPLPHPLIYFVKKRSCVLFRRRKRPLHQNLGSLAGISVKESQSRYSSPEIPADFPRFRSSKSTSRRQIRSSVSSVQILCVNRL